MRPPDLVAAELLARARAALRWAHRDLEARVQVRPLLEQALQRDERAIRLSPHDPYLADWLTARGMAALHLRRADGAVEWLARAVERQPDTPGVRLFLAGALGAAGRTAEAQAQMGHFIRLRPGFTLREFQAREPSSEPVFLRQREQLYAGLRMAGMPE